MDDDSSNDTPRPDFDPLDIDGHGTHTGSTVAGLTCPDRSAGSRSCAKLYAYKVWDEGNSTDECWSPRTSERWTRTRTATCQTRSSPVLLRRRRLRNAELTRGTGGAASGRPRNRVRGLGRELGQPGVQRVCLHRRHAPIARGVVGVAASIDEFFALDLDDQQPRASRRRRSTGSTVHQRWSADRSRPGDSPPTCSRAGGRPRHRRASAIRSPRSLTGETVVVFRGGHALSRRRHSTQRRPERSRWWSATTRPGHRSPSPRTTRPSRSRRS